MRFFNIRGELARNIRSRSGGDAVVGQDLSDPSKLAQVIRGLSKRVSELEARLGPVASEYEMDVAEGGEYKIAHGYGAPVRFWVTHYQQGSFESLPSIQWSPESDSNNLVFTVSGSSGGDARIIVRVEPTQSPHTAV